MRRKAIGHQPQVSRYVVNGQLFVRAKTRYRTRYAGIPRVRRECWIDGVCVDQFSWELALRRTRATQEAGR